MELELTRRSGRPCRPRLRFEGAGFSLVEALLAAVIFLMVVIGVLPLFTQATVNNFAGRESTNVANLARSRAEELLQLPFNSDSLTLQAGTTRITTDYLVAGANTWAPAVDDSERNEWTRVTTIRQFSVSALADNLLEPDEALPADTPPGGVHLKEIEVRVVSARAARVLGPPKAVTVRVLKSK